jgi:hypothetical protein
MALKKCKECGKKVSSKAGACPDCGAPVRKRGAGTLVAGCLIWLIGGIVLLAWLTGRGHEQPERRGAAEKQGQRKGVATRSEGAEAEQQERLAAEEKPALPKRPEEQTEPIPPNYVQNLALAEAYVEAARRQNGVPAMQWTTGSVGVLPGRLKVMQVARDGVLLMAHLDQEGLPDRYFVLSGIDTSDVTDDQLVSLRNAVCTVVGPQTYATIVGAQRTVHRVQVVDARGLQQAAQYYVESLEKELEALKGDRVGQILEARRKLGMWEAAADRNERAAQEAERFRAILAELGEPTEEEIARHEAEKRSVTDELQQAREGLHWLRFPSR